MCENSSKIALNATAENNLNKSRLPYACIALFWCHCVPGGSLEPFRRVILSGGLLPQKRKERLATSGPTARTQSSVNSTKMVYSR